MSNVVQLFPSQNIPDVLRKLADDIESGVIETNSMAIISIPDIYQIGTFDNNDPATEFVFNCNYGLQKMMMAAMEINK